MIDDLFALKPLKEIMMASPRRVENISPFSPRKIVNGFRGMLKLGSQTSSNIQNGLWSGFKSFLFHFAVANSKKSKRFGQDRYFPLLCGLRNARKMICGDILKHKLWIFLSKSFTGPAEMCSMCSESIQY